MFRFNTQFSSLGSIDPCVSYFVVFHVFVAYSKTDYFTFHKSTDDAYICMEEATSIVMKPMISVMALQLQVCGSPGGVGEASL